MRIDGNATALHPRVSIDQVCLPGLSLPDLLATCRGIGAGNVVLSSPMLLADGGIAAARGALDDPKVAALNHPFAIFPDLPADDGRATETLAQVIAAGAALGAKGIYLLTGGRGGLDWAAAADRFAALVAPGAAAARAQGMALMIENASPLYADIHIAHSLADTIALAERAGVGICVELFFCWAEAGIETLLRRAMPRCGLVQVSDYVLGDRALPARAVPGDGAIPLERLLGTVLEAGYTGVLDIELIGPRIDAEGHVAAARRAGERLSEMLIRLGA